MSWESGATASAAPEDDVRLAGRSAVTTSPLPNEPVDPEVRREIEEWTTRLRSGGYARAMEWARSRCGPDRDVSRECAVVAAWWTEVLRRQSQNPEVVARDGLPSTAQLERFRAEVERTLRQMDWTPAIRPEPIGPWAQTRRLECADAPDDVLRRCAAAAGIGEGLFPANVSTEIVPGTVLAAYGPKPAPVVVWSSAAPQPE
jgi:hypothetical protein